MTRKTLVAAIMISSVAGLLACSGSPRSGPDAGESDSPPAAPLFDDLGSHHHGVTTTVELAQKYFDQGLRLVYGFNHDEAERAFRESARLDPKCAMAWWGVALALGPNINLPLDAARNQRALEAVQNAQSLLSSASEAERAYIAAISTRYASDTKMDATTERSKLDRDYGNAMKELSRRYPDDIDAAVLYAESLMDLKPWQLWTVSGKPQDGTEEIVRILESALARDPGHPGANHYYIHAVEASPHPEKAAASADRLKTLVPGAGHLVHMPAHIYMRTGDYQGAVEANANAARTDEAYIARTKAQGVYPMMYTTHNFMFLSAAAGMTGQSQQALESAARAVSIVAPMAGHEPMAEYVLPSSIFAMSRFGKWDDILAYARPSGTTPVTLAFWNYARGLAHVAKGDLTEARKDRDALKAEQARIPADLTLNLNRAHTLLAIASSVLDARLAAAPGDRDSAIAHWKKAVDLQDQLTYDEPPAWYYPVRESLGGEYLRARRFAEAEQVFLKDLQMNPNNGRSLFGLREALRAQSKSSEDAGRRFDEAWKHSTVQLEVESL